MVDDSLLKGFGLKLFVYGKTGKQFTNHLNEMAQKNFKNYYRKEQKIYEKKCCNCGWRYWLKNEYIYTKTIFIIKW